MFVIIESKNKIKKLIFEALSGALALALGKARNPGHPSKFFQKKKFFAGCPMTWHPAKKLRKKIKKLFAGCPLGETPGKEIIKKIKTSLPGASPARHPAKKI